jgi:hypothetical protein
MNTSIVLDSLVKTPTGILVGFTVANIGPNDQVFYIIDDTEDPNVDQYSASITSNVKNAIGEGTGGKVYFDALYSTFNVVNDRVYEVQIYVQKYNPASTAFSTNVLNFQKKSPLVVPEVLSYVGLDSFVLVDLSNNDFRVNSEELSFTIKNTSPPHDEPTKEILFNLSTHTSDTFKLDLSYNFDKYEIFCKTIDNIDQRTSEISKTLEVYSINSSHPAVPTSETIATTTDKCQVTSTLTFTNDWETGHDDYPTIRVFVYDSSIATIPFTQHDLSTADIKAAGLTYNIVTDVTPGGKYDLHYSTKNINRPNSHESTKETIGSYWYAFDPTPNQVSNVQLVNQDEEQFGLTFTGITNASATENGFILNKYIVELIDSNNAVINTQDVTQTDTNTSYSLVLDNANNGVTAGTVYKCRVKVKYTTFHENSANDTIYYSSIDSNTRMAYKMIDDFLQLTSNKITTDGENVKLELIGSDGSNGIFPLNYNIELMYKNDDGNYVNVVDPNNSTGNDANLNRFVDASTLGGQSLIYNYTFDMLDHEEDSTTFTTSTTIRYNNFNSDVLGTEYSFRIVTQYRDYDNNVLSDKLTTSYNISGFYAKTYDTSPTYAGTVSINSVDNESASIAWTKKTEEPAGLTFRRYIVNLFDENNILQDTSGNENESDSSNFYLLDNEGAVFSYLTNGTNYYFNVAVQYQTTHDGYTSLVTIDTPFNQSDSVLPYENNLSNNATYRVQSVNVDSFNNNSNTDNNFNVSWIVDTTTLTNNLSAIGLVFKKYRVRLVRADNTANIASEVFIENNINSNTYTFLNIPYNNNGYKCTVTCFFNPQENNASSASVNGDSVPSGNLLIPYDKDVSSDNNFSANSVSIDSFTNIGDANTFNVSWVVDHTYLDGQINDYGLNFVYYKVDLVDAVTNAIIYFTTVNSTSIKTHSFTEVAFRNNGYKCNVTGYYTPKDTTVTDNIIGASVSNGVSLIPYNTSVIGEAVYEVTNVVFPTLDNQSISISFTLPVNLTTELDNAGLNFSYYKVDMVNQGVDTIKNQTFNIENIGTNSHTFSNVAFNNDGYKCHVTTVVNPKDVNNSELISTNPVLSTRIVKPFDDEISDDVDFQPSNILFPTLDNQSISISFDVSPTLVTKLANIGLDFRHYKVVLISQGADDSINQTINITDIGTTTHTFTSVAFNNFGYKCQVTCDYKPKDADSTTQSIQSTTISTRIVKPFDDEISDDVDFQASNILFPTLDNQSISISFDVSPTLVTDLTARGLDFRHYKVDLVSQTNQSIHKTVNITAIGTTSHTFSDVAYNNDGYRCQVICDYKPRDADSATHSIQSATVVSTRIAKPYDNIVNDDSNFTVLSPSIDSFVNVADANSVTVTWQKSENLTTNMSNKGLQFKHYYLELVNNTTGAVVQSFSQTNINTLIHTFDNVAFNATGADRGYKFRVRIYYQPLDTDSLADSVEVVGNVIEDSRVLIPYNTNLAGEGQYDIDSVDFSSYNNNLINSLLVNWTKPAALATTIHTVGLTFQKYLVELYISGSPNVTVDTKNITDINTLSTTFTSLAYNNTGYKVKVTVIYNPLDADNASTDIYSDVVHNTRAALIPYDQVVNDDSNYNVTSVDIDSFSNVGTDHSIVVSWIVDYVALQTRLTNNGLNFSKYLVELIDTDDNSVAKSVDVSVIGTLSNTFTDVVYNTLGYTCRVTGYYIPKDSVASVSVVVQSATIVSTRTLIPYDNVVNDDNANFAVQSVVFDSFNNVDLKNEINVVWTVPVNLANNIQNVGLSFKHYLVELIDQDDSSVVSDNVTSINTLTYKFNNVSYNTNGYKFRTTAVFQPRDSDSSTVEVASTPLLTTARTLIVYDKVIDAQDFVVTYETNDSKQLTVNWNGPTNLNGVGLDIKHFIVKLYSSTNIELSSQTLTTLSATFNELNLNNNPHYAEVSAVYKPRDAIFSTTVEVTGGFNSEILNTVNIYDVTADVTQFVSMDLTQTSAAINSVNLNASWSLPNYTANNLLLSQIELELRKNSTIVVQSASFTEAYTSYLFSDIAYSYGDSFTIKMRLTLKSTTNDIYVGDYQETSARIYAQIPTTDITNHNLALSLTETTSDINSTVNMSWANQAQNIGNYEFDKYNIVVHNNTDNSEVYNVDETVITNVSYDALNITNGKSYNFKVTAFYKSYVDPIESVSVMDPVVVSYTTNSDNTVAININFVNLDISLNTDTIAFDINPNGRLVNKIQYLAVPSDITSEGNYTDGDNATNFKLIVTENVNFNPYGSISHTYSFNNTLHGWNGSQGIRLAVVNLYNDSTILGSDIKVLE